MGYSRREYLAFVGAGFCYAAEDPVIEAWRRIASETDGTVGAAMLDLDSGRRLSLHGDERFPLASVCKLPIAINILERVAEGKLSLHSEIEIPHYDLVPYASEVAQRWPKQKRFELDELVELMLAKSDNTAVQTLFRLGGNGPGMAARFGQWRIAGFRVDRSELRCGLDASGVKNIPPVAQWNPEVIRELTAKVPPQERLAALRRFIADPRDSATPHATLELLAKLFRGELLPPELTARLIENLRATTTGPNRIKGDLPAGTVVAHKTGTTGSVQNLNGSTNDVGVITLSGQAGSLAIAVYVKGSTRSLEAREKVIARIARIAFDSCSGVRTMALGSH